jgi:Xaa-Pro aminopeptidase
MAERKFDAYLLTRSDSHYSEYLCDCDEQVNFISNFSGSSATVVITHDEALLWTDGRYFLQVDFPLGP